MKLSIIPNGPVPVYRQLYEEILSQIVSGELVAGTALPPIRTVARELGISVITVRSAWEALESDGLIVTRAGSGCFTAALGEPELKELKAKLLSEPIRMLIGSAEKLNVTEDELTELIREGYRKNN